MKEKDDQGIKMEKDRLHYDLEHKLAKKNETIRQHTDKLLKEAKRLYDLGYIQKDIYNLLMLSCEYHDYGKLNPEFDKRIHLNNKYNERKEIPHNLLSFFFVRKDEFNNEEDYKYVAASVALHHDYSMTLGDVFRDDDEKNKVEKLLSGYKDYIELDWNKLDKIRRSITRLARSGENTKFILLKGLLHRCDYSASAGIECEHENNFLEEQLEEMLAKWKEGNPSVKWNEMQIFCKENQDRNIIVTAPTGMGKTEAGLLWIGNHKGFFVLPLTTAINAMYFRILKEVIGNVDYENKIGLLHGETKTYYVDQETQKVQVSQEEDLNNLDVVLDYYDKTKQMTLPLTICTLDQIFDFVFQYQGYEYKLAILSYSKIVIDEIQMYDPSLLAYLIFGIKKIHEVGGKIAIITATLPPFAEEKIKEALNDDYLQQDYSGLEQKDRHNMQVIKSSIDVKYILDVYEKRKREGKSNKILVVCNSVEVAQETYNALKESNVQVNLLHAKFTKKDRRKKEEEILKFGKTYCDNSKEIDCAEGIWVTTSVVEASLDIDFDILFTELMDLFSLFQRMGRCNRKGVKSDFMVEPNCYVFLEKKGAISKFIDDTIFDLSRQAIELKNGIISEQEKKYMIDTFLSVEKMNGSDYAEKYNDVMSKLKATDPYDWDKADCKLRDINTISVMPLNQYNKHKTEIEDAKKVLYSETSTPIDKIVARKKIYDYTLNLEIYKYIKISDHKTEEPITIGRKETIPILDCEYSSEIGYVNWQKKQEKKEADSGKGADAFI